MSTSGGSGPTSGAAQRTLALLGAVLLAALVVAALPGGAAAEQESQPGAAVAGTLTTGDRHSCALSGTAVRCWGAGDVGQLGYGNTKSIGDNETPGSVGPIDLGGPVKAISAGNFHTCALLVAGTVRCWGYGRNGRLGYGSSDNVGDDETPASVPVVDLGAGRTAKAISAGDGHSCALLDDDTVRCWGFGLDGRLGLNNNDDIGDDESPASVGPINLGEGIKVKTITAGGSHTCAIVLDDSVRCWGFSGSGRLGYGNTRDVGRLASSCPVATPCLQPDEVGPVDLGAGRTARAISAGAGHTCAVLDNGAVRCWGNSSSGRLGYGNERNVGDTPTNTPGTAGPVDLGAGRTAKAISAGGEHTCALLDDDNLRCWGYAAFGQLGYGNAISVGDIEKPSSVAPVNLGAGRTARAVSAGTAHTCARLDDDSVRCWGYGLYGRLGYCNQRPIGDDETAGSAGPVDLGTPGIAGARCPTAPVPPPLDAGGEAPSAPAIASVPALGSAPSPEARPGPDPIAAALAAQTARASALRSCVRGVTRAAGVERRRALKRRAASRRASLRQISRRAEQRRSACRRRFGRTPGRISHLAARAIGSRKVRVTFWVAGTDGPRGPGARSYVVKQSLRPIRTAADFARARPLCKGKCSFSVTSVESTATLTVTDLRRGRAYHYAVAARDNVSGRPGPRSAPVTVRVR